jgi:hypothetical protein
MALGEDYEDFSPGFGRELVRKTLREALAGEDQDIGPIRQKIEQGLGQKAADYGTKGLGHLGDILDIPGAFVRGLVGAGLSAAQGEFGVAGERLLSAIPGSEEIPKLFGSSGLRAPTGSDLLSDVGVDIGNTMEEERRIRIAMAAGLSRAEASRRLTTRYEEEALSESQQVDFQNILQDALAANPHLKTGITSDDIKRATDASDFLGFAAEVALDPLTYFTFGASAAGKASKLVRAAEIAARLEHGPGEAGMKAGRAIVDAFRNAPTFADAEKVVQGLKSTPEAKQNLLNALSDAYKGGTPDLELGTTLLDQIRRGQFKAGFKLPGVDEPVLQDGATKAIELVGNGISAIGQGAMRFRPVAEFVAKHPGLANAPRKFWLRLSGEARKADVLGNDALTEIYMHEQHFNRTAGYEALKYQADLKVSTAAILNDLNAAQKGEVLKAAPALAENPTYRAFARSGLVDLEASSTKVKNALLDYADLLRVKDDELFKLQERWGLGVHQLVEDFEHIGRQATDDILDLMSKNPDARAAWLGAKTKLSREALATAVLDAEKGRKLRGMGWDESAEFMRKVLKPYGLADDAPVWKDPVETMLRRSETSVEAAKLRNLTHVAAEVYGRTPDGAVDLARQIVREAADATTADAARRSAIAQEMLAESQAMQAGFREGRAGVRGAAKIADRQAGRIAPAAERAFDLGQQADEVGYAAEAGAQMRKGFPVEAENVLRSFADEAKERVRALAGADAADLPAKITDALRLVNPKTTPRAHAFVKSMSPNKPAEVAEFKRILAEEVRLPSKSVMANDMQRKANEAADKYVAEVQRAQDAWFEANPNAVYPRDAKKYAKETYGAYARAVRQFQRDLKATAPANISRELDRMAGDMLSQVAKLQTAEGAVGKPVARVVNQRVRDADKKAALAQEILSKSDVNQWSPEAKAQYVLRSLEKAGLGPNRGELSALELMLKSKIKLSDDLEDLAAVAVKFLDEADGKEFTKYATNHYWQHLDKPGAVQRVYSAIKGIYQRSTLARVASLSRDLIGTTSQGLLTGAHNELAGAIKGLGSLSDWRQGIKQADDVLHLKAAGVLRTTKGEALEGKGALAGVPLLGKIEESGVIGGTLRALGAEKVGKLAGEKIGVLNEARAYWEEAWRVAVYRKSIKEGKSTEDAIGDVLKFFGRYDELGRLERKVLNNITLFWSYMVRSVPATANMLVHHPAKSRLALTLLSGNITSSEAMPEWMRRQGGWMLGQDENGNYSVINLGNSTYFSPTMSALQSDFVKEAGRGNFGRAVGEGLREVARSAPPMVTGIYERLAEREAFTNESWWDDPNNRVGSRLRAPAGFYWLDGTALGDLLGVKVTSEETEAGPKIKQITMDPEIANYLSFIPGLEPMLTDASSLVDPRRQTGPGVSLGKGLARQAGVPLYDVAVEDERLRDAKRFRAALAQSVDKLPGGGLRAYNGNVFPNQKTERGRQIKDTMDKLLNAAKDSGVQGESRRAWMYDNLSLYYPEEARWLKLNYQLHTFEKLANKPHKIGELDDYLK